jgi:hypothetical protein
MFSNIYFNLSNQNTVRQANVVTSIKQPPVLKNHIFLALS